MKDYGSCTREEALIEGMGPAWWAAQLPSGTKAAISPWGDRTWSELNANANRMARLMRGAGLQPGDSAAACVRNRPQMMEFYYACLRSGIRYTPVNWHLNEEEAGYVIDNCEAKAVLMEGSDAAMAKAAVTRAPRLRLKLSVGGDIDGFTRLEAALADMDPENLKDPVRGNSMLYTSGTTGRPKGVWKKEIGVSRLSASLDFNPLTDRVLMTGPSYHSAPLGFNMLIPMTKGVGVVMMDKWDAEDTLKLIEEHKVTHTHLVATMFHRMLHLPDEVKQRYDTGSLRHILHGAAPTPVHVKKGIIDWFGPIVYEYYAGTEGSGGFFIDSEEWLKKPGSVGTSDKGAEDVLLLDEDGDKVKQGDVGTLYFRRPETGSFEYYKDPAKTARTYRGDYFTLGDMGYLDEDGYLFLTGRSAETIISGGVNIYPQEIDERLLQHDAVQDVCTIGVPNEEWGEEVKSVIQLKTGVKAGDKLRDDILAFAAGGLARFKVPRSIDFTTDLPRMPSGKIQRQKVRGPYWAGRDRSI